MARKTNKLNLNPEARQVLSSDFNLFYKPQAKPEIAGMKELTASLNNFVNDAGAKMVIASEFKEKKVNEAEAIKEYNKNRTAFNERVNSGTLPKEANPYFIDKYKELELNSKAQEFKILLGQKYAELQVSENPNPNAFQEFYENQIKQYVSKNNLGAYKPTDLEKGFFTKTSNFKNQLLQTHVSTQMSTISDQYKINFQNNIQGMFEGDNFEEIGANISEFIKDKTLNGISKGTAQKYLLETLMNYAENTGDFEYAEKILTQLPQFIELGTGKFGNIKGLKDEFFQITEKLQERADAKQSDDNKRKQNLNLAVELEATDLANKYATISEIKELPEYKDFSENKKQKLETIYKARNLGFSSQTNPDIDIEIDRLITEDKLDEALAYLNNNQSNMQQAYYNSKYEEIKDFKISGKDGLLANDVYQWASNELEELVEIQARNKIAQNLDPLRVKKFEAKMVQWLASHPVSDKMSRSTRRDLFEKEVRKLLINQKSILLKGGVAQFEDPSEDLPEIPTPADQTITFD